MSDTNAALLATMQEIRNWVRAAAYPGVRKLLEEALPDGKSRQAYQMTDGKNSRDAVCKSIKLGTLTYQALQQKCVSQGLMTESDGRRYRLFDLNDFGLIGKGDEEEGLATNGRQAKQQK